MIDQRTHVLGHDGGVIGGRIVQLARGAVAADIERDHPPAGLGQTGHPSGMHPVYRRVGGKAVDQDDRLAFALVEKRDLDPIVLEMSVGIHDGGTKKPRRGN